MTEIMDGQTSLFAHDTEFGKMSQAHSRPTEDKISKRSLKSSSGSQNRKHPMFLCLKRDGQQADASSMKWESGLWLGGYSMPNIGECHKDENGLLWLPTLTDSTQGQYCLTLNIGEKPSEEHPTHLSDILEENPNPRYNLSPRACAGILSRASRRGKQLPEMLKTALEEQSRTPSKFEGGVKEEEKVR